MLSKMLSVGEKVGGSEEDDSFMEPNCAVEYLSVSLQSCEPFCAPEIDSFESLAVAPDTVKTDVIVGALDNISITESSGQKDGNDAVGSDDVTFDKNCPNTICASLQTSNVISSGSLLTKATGRSSRKCKTASNKNMTPNFDSLELGRRRRSFSKKPCSSNWGSLENIGQTFKQIADADLNQIEHKKSRKARGSRGDAKRTNNQRSTSSLRPKKEILNSSSRIRLKVTFGGSCPSDISPVVMNDLRNSCGTQRKPPKFTEDIKKLEGIPSAPSGHDGIASQIEVDLLEEAVDNRCLDPGTSPDSEVINIILESQISENVAEDDILIKKTCVVPGEVTSSNQPPPCRRNGKKKNKLSLSVNCSMDDKPLSPEVIDKPGVADEHRHLVRMINDTVSNEACMPTTTRSTSVRTSSSGVFSIESPLTTSGVSDFDISAKTLKVENDVQGGLCSSRGVRDECPELGLTSTKPRDHEDTKTSRSAKSRLGIFQAKSLEESPCRQNGDQLDLKAKTKSYGVQAVHKEENYSETGNHTSTDHGETKTGCSITLDVTCTKMNGAKDEFVPPRNAWVSCDNCYKWRRIPAALADYIEDAKSRWICKDNVDKDFADCSVPQEKSNAEIDAELDISDASCEEDAGSGLHNSNRMEKKKSIVSQQSSWKLIRSNHFLHRTRKTQTIDEIMVCHCKAPLGGRMGCGDGCLNRMLNIECVKGTCPCGELCSNNQFQKRKYAKLKCFRSGRKGYGLQLLEDIHEGQFVIEYVGEVLDMHAYEDRQKEYARKGHKHFYFMTLNCSEVIDACAKGNLGRFINHSCEPNCRTEKFDGFVSIVSVGGVKIFLAEVAKMWMVNGEICIGLFALRDIKKGEEVTFDYNYVRVFGAAAKKCVCGSSLCRGYIGGDPSSGEIIVQDDSEEEYSEPVTVCEYSDDNMENIDSESSSVYLTDSFTAEKDVIGQDANAKKNLEAIKEMHVPFSSSKQSNESDVFTTAAGCMVMSSSIEDFTQNASSTDPELQNVMKMDGVVGLSTSVQTIETLLQLEDGKSKIISVAPPESSVAEETSNKSLSTTQSSETSTAKLSRSLIDNTDIWRKLKYDAKEDRNVISASRPLTKTSQSPSSVKKGKPRKSDVLVKNPAETGNKVHQLPYKSKKLAEGSSSDPFEAVQVKLNELLDAEGGISKRKDASRGYLKLLFLTAASGDSGNGEAIQSNRDLSMILDALLKTKSRKVLADIINKNGLQMLHNIVKRYRKEFHKIPILRKLLKVLEYLSVREILTLEHITSGPRCAGVESFRESILLLTEHDDKQVHHIARNFRDKWIPRPIRKYSCMDRDTGRMDLKRGGSNCNSLPALHNQSCDSTRRQPGSVEFIKQPTGTNKVCCDNLDSCSVPCSRGSVANGTRVRKRKSRWDQPAETNLGIGTTPHTDAKIHSHQSVNHSPRRFNTKNLDDNGQAIDEDVPPGFSLPHKCSLVSSSPSSVALGLCPDNGFCPEYPCEVVVSHPQERFISRLPVSFGIPLNVVQQFGRPLVENAENRVVAAGIPFHPCPPLPPYPRDRGCPTPASSSFVMQSAAVASRCCNR